MDVCVLGSGSKGNSIFIKTRAKILIDAGFSCLQIQKRLSLIGERIEELDAIFVTHEHTDHVRGLDVIHGRYGIPVYIKNAAMDSCNVKFMPTFMNCTARIKDLEIQSVPTSHDAADPCGYVINGKLGVFTDLGYVCGNVSSWLPRLDSVILESNHDVDMLLKGRYPYVLKQRILSKMGHLSNIDCGLCLRDHENIKTVFLAHLSENNNTPELAYNTVVASLVNHVPKIIMTHQEAPTPLQRV